MITEFGITKADHTFLHFCLSSEATIQRCSDKNVF